jgi:hypothetical protein
MFFENFMKIFEIKKCERFIKNCILRQCFNCQKYEHIKKHCRIVVVCEKCVMRHHISECDSSIIEKYKMCETCENREHIAWSSKCRMRRKKKQKTEHVRQIRMWLYFVSEAQIAFNVFWFVINSSTTSFTISITNSKDAFSKWKMIKIKKKKISVWSQTFFSNLHRFRDESSQTTIWQAFATEARERIMRSWIWRTWKKHCIAIRWIDSNSQANHSWMWTRQSW